MFIEKKIYYIFIKMDRFNKLKDWQKVLAGVCVVIIVVGLFTHYRNDNKHHKEGFYMGERTDELGLTGKAPYDSQQDDSMSEYPPQDFLNLGYSGDGIPETMNQEDIYHESFANQGAGCFTMFYAPWCGHCKNTLPTWQEFKEKNQTPVVVNEVNCDEDPELGKLHNVQGYPTIKYLPGGLNNPNGAIEFSGARTAPGFMNFLQENVSGDPSALPDQAKYLHEPRGGAPPPNRAGNPVPTTSYVGQNFDME